MISDLFPPERLTFAMAVYSLGATIGSGTAIMLAGAIVYWATSLGDIHWPIIGAVAHWQLVFFIIGIPGLFLGMLVFTFPEPARRGRNAGVQPIGTNWISSYLALLQFIKGHVRFFAAHYSGFTIASSVVSGCVGWYPVHLMRAHSWSEAQVGAWLGMSLLVAGVIGKFVGGLSVDAMYQRGYRDAQLRWFGGCLLLAGPLGAYGSVSASPWIFLSLIGVYTALFTSFQACAMSSLNLVTPNHLRGAGVAVYSTVAGLLGGSVGSVLVPLLSRFYVEPSTAIGYGMATFMMIGCPLAAICLFSGMKAMRTAMAQSQP